MATTSGFGVQVMPQIQFASGAELAGRGPGEAIAGFNSGIGAINAIQNTRQKALLAPIEQQEAQARLAQIVGSNDFSQQIRPYQIADARYQAAKATLPIRNQTGFDLVQVPQMNADGTPTVDEQGNPVFNVMKRASGSQVDPTTGQISPFQEITGVQTPADTLALHSSIAQKNRDYADAQSRIADIRQQLADAATQRAQSDSAFKEAKMQHYQDLKSTGKYEFRNATDPKTGELVLIAVNKADPTDVRNLTTGMNPIQKQDFLASLMADAAKNPSAAAPAKTSTNPFSSLVSGVKNIFSSTPTVDPSLTAPVGALPNVTSAPAQIPRTTPLPADTNRDIDEYVNNLLPSASAPTKTPSKKFTVELVNP